MAIQFNNIAAPNFKDSNDLMRSGAESYQNAIKGLGDAVKTVQTDVRARANAELTNYLSMAQSPEEFNDPDFKAGYEQLKNSLIEYDAPLAAKELDARPDLLQDRVAKGLSNINAQNVIDREPLVRRAAELDVDGKITSNATAVNSLGEARAVQDRAANTRAYLAAVQSGNTIEAARLKPLIADPAAVVAGLTNLEAYNQTVALNPIIRAQAQTNILKTNADIEATKAGTQATQVNTEGQQIANAADRIGGQALANSNTWATGGSKNYTSNINKFSAGIPKLAPYSSNISNAASEYGVDVNLLRALLSVEASGNPNATSEAGAKGLGQIMPPTRGDILRETKIDAYANPESNIRATAYYLAKMIKANNGNVKLGLASYNAGLVRVQKSKGIPQNGETPAYVERISDMYSYLQSGQDGTKVLGAATIGGKNYGSAGNSSQDKVNQSIRTSLTNELNLVDRATVASKMKSSSAATTPSLSEWESETLGSTIGKQPSHIANAIRGIKGVNDLSNEEQLSIARSMMGENEFGFGAAKWYNTDNSIAQYKEQAAVKVKQMLERKASAEGVGKESVYFNHLNQYMGANNVSAEEAGRVLGVPTAVLKRFIKASSGESAEPVYPQVPTLSLQTAIDAAVAKANRKAGS